MLAPDSLVTMARAGMLSPDGTCYAFDRRANGMVPGEAVAVIVLKPLNQAIADGDPIHAVILGSGINYDGKTNGITAPNGVAQAELVRTVLAKAGVQPGQVEYIVTHGTGTRLGDPVEVNALSEAFRGAMQTPAHCALTSCKTNFGHAFAASGLVSIIALVQAMRKETIPASLHFRERNEFIPWENSPFYVNTENRAWPARPHRARIGAVSAFGMSGTNAHVILRDHVALPSAQPALPRYHLLVWSAKNAEACARGSTALRASSRRGTSPTTNCRRSAIPCYSDAIILRIAAPGGSELGRSGRGAQGGRTGSGPAGV